LYDAVQFSSDLTKLERPMRNTLGFGVTILLCLFSAAAEAQPVGTMMGWGNNNYGQAEAQPGLYRAVATGNFHSLALRDDGSLVAWGRASYGAPLLTVPSGNDFVAIAAGWSHSLALRSNGTIEAWGYKGFNVPVQPASGTYVAIAAGENFSVALRADGTLYGWGQTSYCTGCSPCPGSSYSAPPWDLTAVPTGNDFVAISASGHFGLAQRADGTLAAWGADHHCQVTNTPTQSVTQFSAGHHHGWAMINSSTYIGWGENGFGQAITTAINPSGLGCNNCYKAPPSPFPAHLQQFHGGYYHTTVTDGWGLVAWGNDIDGQSSLIDPNTKNPLVIPYGSPILQVSSSYDHGLVLILPAVQFGEE
jgi:alpha-tubulin suppressor-like RCC1 family protein